jgi:hypothetical protein
MTDLTKFSKDDLKKSVSEINAYLKKADEKDFDPNESTPDAAHLEDKLGGTSKKIEDKGTETKKADFPPSGEDQSEEITDPSQGDVMSQILAMLKEILGKLNVAPTPEPMAPAPTDQIQHAETPAPVATPSTTPAPSPTKSDININVTKSQVEEILKGMGFNPSVLTQKPKVESGHPIEKGNSLTYEKIKKMSWDELAAVNTEMNPGPYY